MNFVEVLMNLSVTLKTKLNNWDFNEVFLILVIVQEKKKKRQCQSNIRIDSRTRKFREQQVCIHHMVQQQASEFHNN